MKIYSLPPVDSSPSFPVSRLVCFGKRIAQYNGSGPGEFFLAKRQIPVNSTELLYFALSFCSRTLIVLGPSHPPPYLPRPVPTRPVASPSIHPDLYTRWRQKQKEIIREIMFLPSGFSESESRKNRHCFLNHEIFIYLFILFFFFSSSFRFIPRRAKSE